jgi:flagellar hook-length control protein FliK
MVKDAQAIKDIPMKMGAVTSDDLGAKINTSDSGTHYNGLLNSEGQNAEKAFENVSSSKETETGQSALRTMTLDQIVQKAVIHLKNGQHEARIDLKPDYLGHVRMQVITENQQVTVKILTEFSFVKDLIENNAHQLKADLQQQGLNVDKLEVSVSTDRDEHKHSPGKGDRLNPRSYRAGHGSADNLKEEVRLQAAPLRHTAAGASAVDYFA